MSIYTKSMRLRLICSVFLIITVSACSSAPKTSAEKTPEELSDLYLTMGTQALVRGEHSQAVTDFKKAIKENAKNAVAYNHMGLAYYSLGKKDLAWKTIEKSTEIDPTYSDAYINLGNLAMDRQDLRLAGHFYERALDNLEYKFRHRALTSLAQLRFQQNNIDDAKKYLFMSLQSNPDYCLTHFLLGSIYNRENNAVKAAEEFKKSTISSCAHDVEAQYQLGLALTKSKQFERARKQLVYVIEQYPTSTQAKKAGETLRNIP